MNKFLPLSLIAVCAMLAIALAYVAFAPIHPVTVNADARRLSFAAPQLLSPPPEENFSAIDERPVFNPARRPVPDATQPDATGGSPSELLLVGVIIAPEKILALLKDKTTSQTLSAAPGAIIDGWRVDTIESTQVTLSSTSGRFTLPLSNPLVGGTQSAAPQPAPDAAAHTGLLAPVAAAPLPPPVVVSTAVTTPQPSKGTGKPALLTPTAHGSVATEALKGAPIDPSTGEPTL
ncbi:MAG TPA: hypothetical protein VGH02_13665 [Rhizomicrobium sp.]|jgi:hypothetical protein